MNRARSVVFLCLVVSLFTLSHATALQGDPAIVKIFIRFDAESQAYDYRLTDSGGALVQPLKTGPVSENGMNYTLYTYALDEGEIFIFKYTKTINGMASDQAFRVLPAPTGNEYVIDALFNTIEPYASPSPSPTATNAPGPDKLTIVPGSANALVLEDTGAVPPQGFPGEYVMFTLPLRVNREYLPSEQYVLRNITIEPDIPTQLHSDKDTIADWPFDIDRVSYLRTLSEMTYDSSTSVSFEFRIAQDKKAGIYPVKFKLYGTIWRSDSANGTIITEDVEFTAVQYLKVLGGGAASGADAAVGLSPVFDTESDLPAPTGRAGERITVLLPVTSHADITNASIEPIFSTNATECPIAREAASYLKALPDMLKGESTFVEFELRLLPSAKSGNNEVSFRLSFEQGGVKGESVISTFVFVEPEPTPAPDAQANDKTPAPAPVVTIESYKLALGGEEAPKLIAGERARLTLKLRNNEQHSAHRLRVTLTGASSVALAPGEGATKYVSLLESGASESLSFELSSPEGADEGVVAVSVTIVYESGDGVIAEHSETLGIPVKQRARAALDTPIANNGKPATSDEPIQIRSTLLNLGLSKLRNVRAHVEGEGLTMYEGFFGKDVLPSDSAAIRVLALGKPGERQGHLLVTYEDSDGEKHELYKAFSIDVSAPAPSHEAPAFDATPPKSGDSDAAEPLVIGLSALVAGLIAVLAYIFFFRRKLKR